MSITDSKSIRLQASSLAYLTEGTDQLTRTTSVIFILLESTLSSEIYLDESGDPLSSTSRRAPSDVEKNHL